MPVNVDLSGITPAQALCLAVLACALAALRCFLAYKGKKHSADAVTARLGKALDGVADENRAEVIRAQAELEATQQQRALVGRRPAPTPPTPAAQTSTMPVRGGDARAG